MLVVVEIARRGVVVDRLKESGPMTAKAFAKRWGYSCTRAARVSLNDQVKKGTVYISGYEISSKGNRRSIYSVRTEGQENAKKWTIEERIASYQTGCTLDQLWRKYPEYDRAGMRSSINKMLKAGKIYVVRYAAVGGGWQAVYKTKTKQSQVNAKRPAYDKAAYDLYYKRTNKEKINAQRRANSSRSKSLVAHAGPWQQLLGMAA